MEQNLYRSKTDVGWGTWQYGLRVGRMSTWERTDAPICHLDNELNERHMGTRDKIMGLSSMHANH